MPRPRVLAACLVLSLCLLIPGQVFAGLSTLVPTEMDEESWHNTDRRHYLTLMSSSAAIELVADALYVEWVEITRALNNELTKSVYIDPEMGFKIYEANTTARIHVLSLAKKARENALASYASTGHLGMAQAQYQGMYEASEADGTNLDQNGLMKERGAAVARVSECVNALRSMKGLPPNALRGFAYFISPFVFPADVGHTFSSNQPGPEEWVGISALPPGLSPEGFPRDTVVHEAGHLIHFEYMGPIEDGGEYWTQYAAIRGKPNVDAGRWENLTVENFAEDVRIVTLDGTTAHRGAYGPPDEKAQKATLNLIQKAIASGSKGAFRITDLKLDDGVVALAVANAPASTGVFVTRRDFVTVTGSSEALIQGVKPHIVVTSMKTFLDSRFPVLGRFTVALPSSLPTTHSVRKAYLDAAGATLWQYDSGMMLIRLRDEASQALDITAHWGKRDIQVLMGLGVISGYPDGTLRPDTQVTRAEFMKMLAVVAGLQPVPGPVPFVDMASHWSLPYVSAVSRAGWLRSPYFGRSLEPDSRLTRGEMAHLLSAAIGGSRAVRHVFADVGSQDRAAVSMLVDKGIVRGFPDGRFHPAKVTSRAEAATALVRFGKVIISD